MRKFLSDFISTLNYRGQQRAYSVLEDARIEKTQVDLIARKLSDRGLTSNLQLEEETEGGLVNANSMSIAFRDASTRMNDLYSTSNDIDLVLNSNISILTSDIKALDDELTALEKSVDNYSFLLSDGGSYDYAYLESFSDTRNREDTFPFLIPDRSGSYFSDGDFGTILANEGALALPQNTVRTYPLTGLVLESNCSAFVTSASSLSNALTTNAGTGWRISVSAPSPVSSSLPSFTKLYADVRRIFPGLNITLELYMQSPSPCDHIKLNPFSDTAMEIAQIELYEDLEGNEKKNLLSVPVELNSQKNFYFDLQPVSKIKIYFSQTNYTRNALEPSTAEQRFRRIRHEGRKPEWGSAMDPKDSYLISKEGENRKSLISRLVQHHLFSHSENDNKYRIAFPKSLHTPSWGSSREELMRTFTGHRNPSRRWINSTLAGNLITQIIAGKLPAEYRDAFLPVLIRGGDAKTSNPGTNIQPIMSPIWKKDNFEQDISYSPREQFRYEYTAGFQNIAVGNSVTGLKGVFVSKILPSPGDVGEVKVKVRDEQFIEYPSDKHQPIMTSVEYSVTNQAVPNEETDWAPIMPVGSIYVTAERFIPDSIGKGFFRFPANLEADIKLYKNGYEVNDLQVPDITIRSATKQTAAGIKLPLGYAGPQDIFTVDYVPAGDATLVNFEKAGYETPPLVASFDADGAGEGFLGTNGQLIVGLQYEPFINYNKVAISNYILDYGLSGYNPVIVILSDGTTALNLTNYKGGTQSILNASGPLAFVQNGDSLMFNKPIEQTFRVYYQYLPNNLRFRVVLRSNSASFISPKVDLVQVKAKTRKADAKRNK